MLHADEFMGVLRVRQVVERDDRAGLVVASQEVSLLATTNPQRQKTVE